MTTIARRTPLISVVIVTMLLRVSMAAPPHGSAADGDPHGPLRTVRSKNFEIRTDLVEHECRELLARLETMLGLISAYWGRPHRGVIPMYVAKDFDRWPAAQIATMDPAGVRALRNGGGVTLSQILVSGNAFQSRTAVYAVADRGTPQHEAVHAYCIHAFGTIGPVWYAEGMAEVGHYWQNADDKSVRVPPYVVRFLNQTEPKPLRAIVDNPLETTGDSWQNYAWRWALCHLLGHNENYSPRFKPLGLQLLNLSARDVSFWQVYGSQAAEIEFEYRLFLRNLKAGYRVDLCSWDWRTQCRPPRGGRPMQCTVRADRGWQASRVKLVAGTNYEFTAEGTWRLSDDEPSTESPEPGAPEQEPSGESNAVTADGLGNGSGRLVGVVFSDYRLSDPIELGPEGTFTAPMDGHLYVRCADDWGRLADNSGIVTVRIQRNSQAE